ncbi:MAG: hypothetical protein ACRC1T_10515 [Clostridium chrysemydis]|uniref:hypothetical protein n=2 Tax=Clostridium chrysemydis TaxID=2665504 RepID=UPI003F2E33D8
MNLKFIWEGISKKIGFSILTVVQFVVAIICIFIAFQTINDINKSTDNVKDSFSNGVYYKIDNRISQNELNAFNKDTIDKDISELIKIKNKLNEDKEIRFLSAESNEVMIKKDETINNTIVTYEPIKYKNHDYLRVQGLCVNEEFLKDMNYKFISGGVGDFQRKSNEFPIILGSSYREKYKVLDTIYSIDLIADSNIQEIKMKVVGILDSGNYVYENGIMAEGKLLDNTIIYPFNDGVLKKERKDERMEGIVKSSLVNHISAGYLVTQNREYINEISNELLEYKYKFKLVDLNDSIKEYKNEIKDSLSPVIVTSIIVILFSLISVIIVMINSISKDKREYGINIMVGATLKDIKFRVIGELYVLLSLSLIVSGVILNTIPELKFNIFDFLLASLCMIFLITLVSLILIYNLNKISIDTLMRRKE